MSDYVIAGDAELRDIWPRVARECNKLLCATGHECNCSWEIGCGVGDQSMRFNIMPINSVDGIDSVTFDALFVVTPSKRHITVNNKIAEESIREFLECLQEKGIAVFASQGQGNSRKWVEFR